MPYPPVLVRAPRPLRFLSSLKSKCPHLPPPSSLFQLPQHHHHSTSLLRAGSLDFTPCFLLRVCRLDPTRAHVPYSAAEAREAFMRVARQHGWEK